MCLNKGIVPHPLTAKGRAATLAGGTAGNTQSPKVNPSSASSATSEQTQIIRDAHDALSAMIAGYLGGDRALLDSGFEALIESTEVMRDAVPKA